jgi:chromosome segregation ATPase
MDVTDSVSQTQGLNQALEDVQERIDTDMGNLQQRIADLEEQLALADNEMRTIMADHSGFADVLRELGESGALPSGERRSYGNY